MKIRNYQTKDLNEIIELFINTVNHINIGDYSPEQIEAWTDNINKEGWQKKLENNYCLVAIEDDKIIGFGDIDKNGYLDHLFVHHEYQRQKIASKLCQALELSTKSKKITTHSSITAKPFFEKRGYINIKEQTVIKNQVPMTNYVMEKNR